MKSLDTVLYGSIRELGPENYKKFMNSEIVSVWDSFVSEEISANVRPIVIEHGVLFVSVTGSAFKDQLKFFAEEIIDAINKIFGGGGQIVNEIRPAKPFQIAAFNERQRKAEERKQSAKKLLDEIALTDEETARCQAAAQKIDDEELRAAALKTLLLQAKATKFKLSSGWHKCKSCDSLCAAHETFCEVCRLKEHEQIRRKLFEIFYDTPWLSSEDVRKIFLDKFPNRSDLCPLDFVNSTRTSLIQLLAGHMTLEDAEEGSNEILRLVMLERQLPPEKITPAIIRRTLNELHFNFADAVRFRRQNFSKFRTLQQK